AGDRLPPSWHASCEIRIVAQARAARRQAWRRGWSCGARGVVAWRSSAANQDWAALGALATWNTFLRGARVRVCGLKEGEGNQKPTGGSNPARGPKVACTTAPKATPGLLVGQRWPGIAFTGQRQVPLGSIQRERPRRALISPQGGSMVEVPITIACGNYD